MNDTKDTLLEWFFLRGVVATGIGFTLELGSHFVLMLLFGEYEVMHTILGTESQALAIIRLILFHVVGWIIAVKNWDAITGNEVDPLTGYERAEPTFVIDQGKYYVEGRVYKK